MIVCDVCGKPISNDESMGLKGLSLILSEQGDYCKECVKKIDSFFKGDAVIIDKKEHEEFLNWKQIIENKKEVKYEGT